MSLQPTPGTAQEAPLQNDGWWPDIDLSALRQSCRLDGTVTPERLRHAALNAVIRCNTELQAWRDQQDASAHDLGQVSAPVIDGRSAKVSLYLRAIYAAVQCELIERYRDIDITARGDRRAEAQDTRIEDAKRDLRWALSDLQSRPRSTVELI